MKFGRTFKMSIEGQFFKHWTPAFPTTLTFDIQRSTFSSANKATFTLYNLEQAARRDIYFDRYVNDQRLKITLQAGYVSSPVLPIIFKGDIRIAWTQRQVTNWLTNVEAFDGGFAFYNAQAAGVSFPSGYTMDQASKTLIAKMAPYGVTLGKVSNISLPNSRGIAFSGTAWDALKGLVPGDGQLFVDNGVANILNPQDYIVTPTIPEISADTGLIGTPRKQGNLISATLIFDPQYVVGQLASLRCSQTWMNSPKLKVVGIHHHGTISAVEGGGVFTDLSLFSGYPDSSLVPVDAAFEGQVA